MSTYFRFADDTGAIARWSNLNAETCTFAGNAFYGKVNNSHLREERPFPVIPDCAGASILAGRDFATELVEKIQDEAYLVDRFGLAGDGILLYGEILQYDGALAIGVHVKV